MLTAAPTRHMVRAAGIVMGSVLLSRILGFFREWTVAHQIGANTETDAYYLAFVLPDFLNYLIAGGALSISFIPIFSKYLAEEREEEGWRVFSITFTLMGLALVVLVVVAEILAPQLVEMIAPGFPAEQRGRVVFLTRLMLPAQVCFYLGGLLTAVQYAKGHFLVPALAPLIYNLGIILGGILLSPFLGIVGFSVGVLAGSVAGNLLLQIWGARRRGLRFAPQLDWHHEGFRKFLRLTIPIMLGFSLVFVDDWLQRWFGSFLAAASITWLSYAKALQGIPIALVGHAAGVASFPFLTQLHAEGKREEFSRMLTGALHAVLFLILPCSALMIVASKPLSYLVFSRTQLTLLDMETTAAALVFFSLGGFAWAAQAILARGFYARRDTWMPTLVGSSITLLSLPMYAWLAEHWQHRGLALASSIGMTAYAVALFLILNRKIANPHSRDTVVFFVKMLGVAVAVGAAGHFLLEAINRHLPWFTPAGSLSALLAAGLAGLILVPLLAKLLRIRELEEYLRFLTAPRAGHRSE